MNLLYFIGILVLVSALLFLVQASARICSGVYLPAFCHGKRGSKTVALTFDDGPHAETLPGIMERLEKYDYKASFFLVGSSVEGKEALVRELVQKGHLVGNHSWSHSSAFPIYPGKKIATELQSCSDLLEKAGGVPVRWFRPPFGVSNPRVKQGWKNSGLQVAGWSIRSFDTRSEKAEVVVKRIRCKLRGGDVILLHEQSPHILEILDLLLPILSERGMKGLTLDQLAEASS